MRALASCEKSFATQCVRRAAMGFLKKLKFWKRKDNVSPTTVDIGVSTEEPEKCDVATMTDYEIVGHAINSDEASLAENAQWCESYPFGAWPADHVEWNASYAYEGYPSFADDSPANGMYAYEGYPSYAYNVPPIQYQEWSYVTHNVPL